MGYPRNRFNVQGMNGKQSADKSASPNTTRRFLQQQKEQDDIENVEKKIRKVMTTGIHLKQLVVHHVRDPSERMPVGFNRGRKCPD